MLSAEFTREEAIAALRDDGPMDGRELSACLALLSWSKQIVCHELDVDEGTVRQWGRDSRPVAPPIAAWLRTLARAHADNPAPKKPARPT